MTTSKTPDKKKLKHGIKFKKPSKKSRYHQGYIDPQKCKKLFESVRKEPIIYRSDLELKFMRFFEQSPSILKWASEPFGIEYYSRLDGKIQNYYPDFLIMTRSGKKIIVEVKPDAQTVRCSNDDTQWAKEAWIKNTDKWNAAEKFAHDHDMTFIKLTEKFFD